jgi:hypothetical protein
MMWQCNVVLVRLLLNLRTLIVASEVGSDIKSAIDYRQKEGIQDYQYVISCKIYRNNKLEYRASSYHGVYYLLACLHFLRYQFKNNCNNLGLSDRSSDVYYISSTSTSQEWEPTTC